MKKPMSYRIQILMASSAVFAVLAGGTDIASAETLQEAMAMAYSGNPVLQAERARVRGVDEQAPQALSGWRPTVTANGTYGTSESDIESSSALVPGTGKNNVDPLTGTLTVTQPVFRGGRTIYGTRQAKATVLAARENLRNVEQQTLLDAVNAYMDVVRDEAVVDLREKNTVVLTRQRQASLDRFEVGEITRTDVAQSEARLSRSQSNLIAAEGALTRSRARYERVVGQTPGTLARPDELPPLPSSEQEALEIALENNPNLLAARYSSEAAAQAVKVAKGAILPSISLRAEYQYAEDPSTTIRRSEGTSAVAQLTVPLYQSGFEYSRVREAKQADSRSRLQIADAQRLTEEAVANAWELLRSARARMESDRQQVRANEIALEGVQQEAQVGSRTTLDVLDAEQELLDARVALVGSERDESVAAFTLLAAVGHLGARNLELQTEYYDPDENYEDVSDRWIGFGIKDED